MSRKREKILNREGKYYICGLYSDGRKGRTREYYGTLFGAEKEVLRLYQFGEIYGDELAVFDDENYIIAERVRGRWLHYKQRGE